MNKTFFKFGLITAYKTVIINAREKRCRYFAATYQITGTKKPPCGGHVLLIIFLYYKALTHGAQSGT
ncbi:hypothetical protein [Dickeya zeae]|uniref:hypothetical protein n=1 Tax=Dickeya zeae TaxID=204042 RepID=UPI0008FBD5CC